MASSNKTAFEEVLRLVFETEGEQGVEELRKALTRLGESSGTSADQANALAGELERLSTTSTNIRNFTLLKATLADTGRALDTAKANLARLRAEFETTENPTRKMERALAAAERQVDSLTKAQNRQTADLQRTTNMLGKAGVDTKQLAKAYADLQGQYGEFGRRADATAAAMGKTAKESRAAAKGVGTLGDSAKLTSASLASIASRLTLVSGAAATAVSALAALTGVSFFKGAIESASTLEDALTEVRAVSSATADEMVLLKEAAEAGGAATKFSSLDAAKGLGELARATGSARGAIAALPAALNLAQAAGIGVADAAQFIMTTLTQFGLGAEQAARVADVLAQAANTTTADVRGLGDALTYAAPLAKQLGLDTEQTVAIIGALADQGFRGERAGTALRNTFSEMLDPASAFGQALRNLGIESTDFATVIDGLAAAGARGEEAILQLDAAARPAILSLVNSGGAALKQLDMDLRAAGGAAAATAKIMGESVAGANESIRDTFDRTRRSLVEPLLEPLRQELFTLSNELEAFAQSPEFEEIKSALTELFIESAGAARELFHEIDFKQLAQSIRDFVGDAGTTMSEFRQNLELVVAAVSLIGEQFSATFNAIQTIVLGVAAGVAKMAESMLLFALALTALPRKVRELAGFTDEAGQSLKVTADVLGKISDDLTQRAHKNFGETTDALKGIVSGYTDLGDAAVSGLTKTADANDRVAIASKAQAAASTEAAAAIGQQGAAAEATAGTTSAAADRLSEDAARLKNAFADLGITSQANLQRAAESAKKNFDLIREAVGKGQATAEDARRAFAVYAQAARAAVADSDVSARNRIENELLVQEAILNATKSLGAMGEAGKAAGSNVAAGASQATIALQETAAAAGEASSGTGEVGKSSEKASGEMKKAAEAGNAMSFSLGDISDKAWDVIRALSQSQDPLGRFATLAREISEQRRGLAEMNDELATTLKQYDEFADRRNELREQFSLLGDSDLEGIIQAEQKVQSIQKQRADEWKRRQDEQRTADLARIEATKELARVETSTAPPAQKNDETTFKVEILAPRATQVGSINKLFNDLVEAVAMAVAPRLLQQIERSRAISSRKRAR